MQEMRRQDSLRGMMALILAAGCFLPEIAGCPGLEGRDDTPGVTAPSPTPDVLAMLESIPGLTWQTGTTSLAGYERYDLTFAQPADHGNEGGAWFDQRLVLLHRDWNAPMVLHTTGYFLPGGDSLSEPAALLGANQLSVEHRFFEPSRPDVSDWETLTIEQAAEDFHRIVEAFAPYYSGRWIGTGASKGGMTAIYHRRFYPEDLDGTVAYVAPLSLGPQDPRYIDFLSQVGTASCREALETFQRTALTQRAALVAYVMDLSMTWGLTYDILGIDMAVEHAVLELPFAFWQYQGAWLCPDIPPPGAPGPQVAEFVDAVSWFYFFSDQSILKYEPYYYQAATQLGYPAISEEAVADLLHFPGTDRAETYVTVEIPTPFDEEAMLDVAQWAGSEGDRIMYIYGESDPWTAGAFDPGSSEDAYRFLVPDGNHGACILDLPDREQQEALQILARWGGVSPETLTARARGPLPPRPRPAMRRGP